jgi:hypothetical protein
MGNLKGKAYSREEFLFKQAHPVKWWIAHQLKRLVRKLYGTNKKQ